MKPTSTNRHHRGWAGRRRVWRGLAAPASVALCLAVPTGCATTAPRSNERVIRPVGEAARRSIGQLLARQVEAWNAGDIDGFMDGYWRSDDLTFVSGGGVTRGWNATREGFHRRYASREAMGRLEFQVIEMRGLGSDGAMVLGRWRVERDRPVGGLFTLIVRVIDGQWRVIYDHTSVDAPPT